MTLCTFSVDIIIFMFYVRFFIIYVLCTYFHINGDEKKIIVSIIFCLIIQHLIYFIVTSDINVIFHII